MLKVCEHLFYGYNSTQEIFVNSLPCNFALSKLSTESLLIFLYILFLWLIINFVRYWVMFKCGFEVNLVNSYLGFTLLYNSLLCYLHFRDNCVSNWGFFVSSVHDKSGVSIRLWFWIILYVYLVFVSFSSPFHKSGVSILWIYHFLHVFKI